MTFINNYTKAETYDYKFSKRFVENNVSYILSLGQINGKGLITKIDPATGNVLWEKKYSFGLSEENINFHKIVQSAINTGSIQSSFAYFGYATNGDENYVFSLNITTGAILWIRKIAINDNINVHLEPAHSILGFYLSISVSRSTKTSFSPTINLFNSSGVVQNSRVLGVTNGMITSFKSYNDGLILSTLSDDLTQENLLFSLMNNLQIRESFKFTNPVFHVQDIAIINKDNFQLVGHWDQKNKEICYLNYRQANPQKWDFYDLSSSAQSAQLQFDGVHNYILENNKIHKISGNNVLWSKKLSSPHASGITNFNIDDQTISLVFFEVGVVNSFLISLSNLDLLTCRTENIINATLSERTVTVSSYSPRTSLQNISLTNITILASNSTSIKSEVCPENPDIVLDENTELQSPNFYLQTAGSDGSDSTKGIHARWLFNGVLGENHLPKGDLAEGNANFNKSADYVKLLRAPYVKSTFTLDFASMPQLVDNTNKVWIYKFNNDERVFYVYFRNHNRYQQVRETLDPLVDPVSFIVQYGNEIIEVENKKELFFSAELEVSSQSINASLQLEALSVEKNNLTAAKKVSFRKIFSSTEFSQIKWKIENGRSIRFRGISASVRKIHLEFYSDFISNANAASGWKLLGEYSLSLDNNKVFNQLEPQPGLVNGNWLRYNDGAYVNINNYKDKWFRNVELPDRNLMQMVDSYITLSNNANNPKGNQQFSLIHPDGQVQPGDNPEDIFTISNLDLLRITSYDFHFARMLGLGTLDFEEETWSGEHVYIAQYYTQGDLQDGEGVREVQHLSMALPTSLNTNRLPLPVELDRIVPGVFVGTDTTNPTNLTDEDGYSFDGKQRYVTLYHKHIEEDLYNPPFFNSADEIDKSQFTYPIYAGVEYKVMLDGGTLPSKWNKPEISHDSDYLNVDTDPNSFESVPIVPLDSPRPLYSHYHTTSGLHYYDTYGINWFSRATTANNVLNIRTDLKPRNLLTPPYEINPLLIITETPLMFTSQEEQVRLNNLKSDETRLDKTLIRVPFYYDIANELLDYRVPENVPDPLNPISIFADDDEVYANEVEIFFRNSTPLGTSGKAVDVFDHPTNPLLSLITTESYIYLSTGETIVPNIPISNQNKFIGGLLVIGNLSYIIHEITSNATGDNPTFTVFKKEVSDGIVMDTIPTINAENLQSPVILNDGLFHTAENMQNEHCWNQGQSLPFKIKVGDQSVDFKIHRELIFKINDDGIEEAHLEKSRGFWYEASVQEEEEVVDIIEHIDQQGNVTYEEVKEFNGLYKITFNNFKLAQHSQFSSIMNSVEWWNGTVRLFTIGSFNDQGSPIKSRKPFKVVRTENFGTNEDLILYCEDPNYNIQDPSFNVDEYDRVKIGSSLMINYYPGYKVFLYADPTYELDQTGIMPDVGQGMRYSIFGLRSVDTTKTINNAPYKSKISQPAVMFAREYIGAETPEQPKGGLFATRPDFFGRSTYTFTTKYTHKPFGLLVCRSNDELLLNALYEPVTVIEIREALNLLGGQEEEFFTNRWENFLDYNVLINDGQYKMYPLTDGYRLPLPNKRQFFSEVNQFIEYHNTKFNTNYSTISENNYGNVPLDTVVIPVLFNQPGQEMKLMDFVQNAIYYSFVPLTEMPIIYNYILPKPYQPVDEKQNVRDKNGYVLPPNHEDVKMAPMMRTESQEPVNSTLYTDFHLDGYSKNFYFYGVREVSSEMKMGEFSKFLGPIKLVNSNPPEAPEVKRIMPILANPVLGILPHIQLEVNRYPASQNIYKINVYRTFDRIKAQSIRLMDLVKVVDLEEEEMLNENIWLVDDYFEDLSEIRYGDGIYYRITVSRRIEYAQADYNYGTDNSEPEIVIEYAPSNASKIVASLMVDTKSPDSPLLNYSFSQQTSNGEILDVIISWNKTVYNGKYNLYKMSPQGNWQKITETPLQTNDQDLQVVLADSMLNSGTLQIEDEDGNPIFHHFKVVVENTSGVLSKDEKILTIPLGTNGNSDVIGFMNINGTFQIN